MHDFKNIKIRLDNIYIIYNNRFNDDGSPKSLQAFLESQNSDLLFKFRFELNLIFSFFPFSTDACIV